SGTLEQLEAQRDEKLTGHIILLQARCRGYLARRKLNTLKLQDLAVRCIQRNVRKWMSVREWPWWRLYVKVAPLLNVHRTEDQLKAKTPRRSFTYFGISKQLHPSSRVQQLARLEPAYPKVRGKLIKRRSFVRALVSCNLG
ncbi:unnamed protein product, partial [Heterotrigona itama]